MDLIKCVFAQNSFKIESMLIGKHLTLVHLKCDIHSNYSKVIFDDFTMFPPYATVVEQRILANCWDQCADKESEPKAF